MGLEEWIERRAEIDLDNSPSGCRARRRTNCRGDVGALRTAAEEMPALVQNLEAGDRIPARTVVELELVSAHVGVWKSGPARAVCPRQPEALGLWVGGGGAPLG